MRRPVYVLGARSWWEDLIQSFVEAAICGVVFLVVLLLVGCGDNVECPPAPCVPASGATVKPCLDEQGERPPRYACSGFVDNVGCTVPVRVPSGELVDALCVDTCEVAP